MQDLEAIEMMKRCKAEITALRARIDALAPKAQAWDALCVVLDLLPPRPVACEPDLAWSLQKRIDELTKTFNAEQQET